MASYDLLIVESPAVVFTAENIAFDMLIVPAVRNSTPPTISNVSPAQGETMGRQTPLRFRLVDDESTFALDELWVGFGTNPLSYELAHDGTNFVGGYASGSTRDGSTGDYSLLRAGGWPVGRLKLRASVVDASGNVVVVHA